MHYTAMSVTLMASINNMAKNSALQLRVIDAVGYEWGCAIGVGCMIIFICFQDKIFRWVLEG